jgi:hypothetical protein
MILEHRAGWQAQKTWLQAIRSKLHQPVELLDMVPAYRNKICTDGSCFSPKMSMITCANHTRDVHGTRVLIHKTSNYISAWVCTRSTWRRIAFPNWGTNTMSACKQHRSDGQSPMKQQQVKKNVQKRWTRTNKECKNKEKRDLTRVTVSPKQYFPAVLIRICSSAASMHHSCKDNWVCKGLNIVYATTESVLLLKFYGDNVLLFLISLLSLVCLWRHCVQFGYHNSHDNFLTNADKCQIWVVRVQYQKNPS